MPKDPYFALAAATIAASAGMAVMSGPNEETYEPAIVNVPGENRPSVPKITAFLCCWARLRPNCCAFAATCQGRTTTDVLGVTLATSEEKSVTFCGHRLVVDLDPGLLEDRQHRGDQAGRVGLLVIDDHQRLRVQVVDDVVGVLRSLHAVLRHDAEERRVLAGASAPRAVADPEMNAIPALANSGPTASTSWLPAGPTTATIFEFDVNCWVTVVA